jgi:hypothetical protein
VHGTTAPLPPLAEQAQRLIDLRVHVRAGLDAADVHAAAAQAATDEPDVLLVVHPDRAPASTIASLVEYSGKSGFVVIDMPDVDEFVPVDGLSIPATPLYTVHGIDRGDHLANWSPNEALPVITRDGRTPLLLTEGIHWLLQRPDALERNHCFMTIGSRLRRGNGRLDARTPAIWISNGSGRDGAEQRNAPKVGWCWAGNRHTWLGFASGTERRPTAVAVGDQVSTGRRC